MGKGKCLYSNEVGVCTVLMGTFCTGFKSMCKFHKTEQEHNDVLNKAIGLNREKGNCNHCKYRATKCSMIGMEEESIDNERVS